MGVKILCAGCSKDEREQAEADVKKALAERAAHDEWTVSLVKLADRWSVTLDAPTARLRGVTIMAPQGRLSDAIREALKSGLPAPASAATATPPAAPAGSAAARPAAPVPTAAAPKSGTAPGAAGPHEVPSGGRLICEKCERGFVIVYESRPGESLETAPVACPHCWHVNRVLIDAEAAFTRDYRAEKA